MRRQLIPSISLVFLLWASVSSAHFQLIFTEQSALNKGQAIDLAMVFTHPFQAGHTMTMGEPEAFYLWHQRGEDASPKKVDLSEYLQEVTWQSLTNKGQAYVAKLPRKVVRSLGDYVFVLQPAPYYEGEEDKYIQQITKMVVNVGGVPGNWANEVELPAEIIPYDKPYANWTGGVFRGIVMANGKPVPNAELEIEYLNHAPNLTDARFEEEAAIEAPHSAFENMGIRTNDRGEFTIGLPKAGWWGICALNIGPQKEHNGKPLSQDAVLWVQVTDLPK